MAIEQISAGSAPIVWSTIDQAFKVINDNFVELSLSIGGGGAVDLTKLASTVAPVDDDTYDLGLSTDRWRDIFLNRNIYLGNAVIGSVGSSINLPAGSTIGENGQLLDENYFKTVRVTGQDDIIADNGTDVLNVSPGSGISILTNSLSDTITISNAGVLEIFSGTGISVNSSTGSITVSNSGVTSLAGTTGQIGVSATTGSITLTNLGVIELRTDPGSGIGLSAGTGVINITNLAPNIAQNVFRSIAVTGSGLIEADSIADTLTISAGYGISITAETLTDTITFGLNQRIDIIGSIFSDGSSLLVDAVNEQIFAAGGFFGSLTGNVTGDVFGNTTGTHSGIVIGNVTGDLSGNSNGYHTGDVTGSIFADNSTMLVDGTNGQIVGPINSFDGGNSISMDPINGVIVGGTGGAQIIGAAGAPVYIGGGPSGSTSGNIYLGNGTNRILLVSNTIDSDDSSALTFEPAVIFNSSIAVDGDLILNGDNRIQANTTITMVPTLSAESSGSILNIQGVPAGEGSPGVVISTPANFIQVGSWVMLADGGLFGAPLSSAPVGAVLGAIYIADGVNWDPSSFANGTPYPVFYDGNDFLPMVADPTP